MQFPNPFKKDKPEETAGDLRIEPQMGNESQAPWDVQSTQNEEEPPAFAVVGDERAKGMPGNPTAQATPSVQPTQSVQPVQPTQPMQPVQPAVTKPVVEPSRVEPVMSSAKPTVASAYDPNDAPVLGDSGSAPAPSAPKKPKPVEPEPVVPTEEEEAPKKKLFSFGFKKRQPDVEDPDDPYNEELFEQRRPNALSFSGGGGFNGGSDCGGPFLTR